MRGCKEGERLGKRRLIEHKGDGVFFVGFDGRRLWVMVDGTGMHCYEAGTFHSTTDV